MINYLQAAFQILQIVNALLLTVHADPRITAAFGIALGAGSQITHITARNMEPPAK
jgi:hypothetical protein